MPIFLDRKNIFYWAYFPIFLSSNLLLSYGPFSIAVQLEIGFFGLILPFLWSALQKTSQLKPRVPAPDEFLPLIPFWLWALLGSSAIFIRFYKITTLSVWPGYDDGLWGWIALRFCWHEGWRFFYDGCNFPGAYAWGLGLIFKYFKPSLFTLWAFPALLSTLTMGIGYWAARQFFSKSFSFLIWLLLAFSFWPLYVGRISDQMVLVLLAEFAFFGLLGFFLKSPTERSLRLRALGLGLTAGAGFYIFISWAAIAAVAGATVLFFGLRRRVPTWTPFLIFSIAALILLVPLWESGFRDSISSYSTVGFWSKTGTGPWAQLQVSLSYLTVLFWGMNPAVHTYQPVLGGFLDPLLGTFFFLGLLELWRRGGTRAWGFSAASLCLMVPGMLTASREPLRILPVLPLLLVVCALGWEQLLTALSSSKKIPILVCLALVFAGLDFYHLAVKYHRLWDSPEAWRGYSKSPERYRSLPILEKIASLQGPGLIYTDFVPGLCDQSLGVLSNSFNAAENPSLSFQNARWAAVLTNVNNKPFLSKRFPQGRAFALSVGLDRPDGGWMLWTFPVTDQNRPQMEKWKKARESFECYPQEDAWALLPMLEKAHPFFAGDPFLESFYWEKWSDLSYRASGFKDPQKSASGLQEAVRNGYPAAHLYWRLGVFQSLSGNPQAARRSFQTALHSPFNLTAAAESLMEFSSPVSGIYP